MSKTIEMITEQNPARSAKTAKASRTKGKHTYKLLFGAWVLLIAGGVYGAYLYTDQLKQNMSADIAKQTQDQLNAIQLDYQKQIGDLQTKITADMTDLQGKVDSLNQLLAFTKDSANDKTDNSNQLYTQLNDVKKKLEELQKNLDVLK